MSASRNRTLGAIAASAAMVVLAACGGGDDKAEKDSATPKASTPAASSVTTEPPAGGAEAFGTGLVVARCYNDASSNGDLKLELSDYHGANDTAARGPITWQSTDLNTHSVGGCDSKHAAAGYSKDFKRLYVSRNDPSTDTSAIGYLSMEDGAYTQLTEPSSDEFTKASFTDPSVFGDRVYYYDVSGEDAVLKSMSLDGKDVRSESTLQKRFDDDGPYQGVGSETLPHIVPGLPKPTIAGDANAESAYTADGAMSATLEANGMISIVKNGGKPVEYDVAMPKNAPASVQGAHRLGGFADANTLIMSDGVQIYSGTIAGKTVTFKSILTNTTEKVITDVLVGGDDEVAFVYELKPGLGVTAKSSAIYTMPVAGGKPTKLDQFENPGLQASVQLVTFGK